MVAKGGREVENAVEKEENKSTSSWKMSISKRENVREVELVWLIQTRKYFTCY